MAAPQSEPAAHTAPWMLDEWLALPEGPPYTELVDGLLVMSPVSAYRHQRLMVRLWQQLDVAAPVEYEVMPESNVALGGDRALIPDLCVIDQPVSTASFSRPGTWCLSARSRRRPPGSTTGRPRPRCTPKPGFPTYSWSIQAASHRRRSATSWWRAGTSSVLAARTGFCGLTGRSRSGSR